jgi:K+-transporting ATPase ATPase C chain
MLIVTGIAYPLILVLIGQNLLPRPASDSASGLDPHVTPYDAFSQISNISKATGIPQTTLTTLVELNIERNKNSNLLAFAPNYANVLALNMKLVKQYPSIYSQFLISNQSSGRR